MNKYQEYVFEGFVLYCFVNNERMKNYCIADNVKSEEIHIKQDDDMGINTYFIACLYPFFYKVSDEWQEATIRSFDNSTRNNVEYAYREANYVADFNWDKPIKEIKISVNDDVVEPLIIKVIYESADVEKYNQMKAERNAAETLARAKIKHSTGNNLVNIYFQPCNDYYAKTNIKLFVPDTYESVPGPYGPYDKPKTWNIIKNINIAEEDFFVAIDGLAYGTYSYVITQMGLDGSILLKTEHIEFKLNAPTPIVNTHTVVI